MSTRACQRRYSSIPNRFSFSFLCAGVVLFCSTSFALAQSGSRNTYSPSDQLIPPQPFSAPGNPSFPEADKQPQLFPAPNSSHPLRSIQPYLQPQRSRFSSPNQCEGSPYRTQPTVGYRYLLAAPVPVYPSIGRSPHIQTYGYPFPGTPYGQFNVYRSPQVRYIQAYPSCRGY